MGAVGSVAHDTGSSLTRIFAPAKPPAGAKAGTVGEAADAKPPVVVSLSASAPAAPAPAGAPAAKSFAEVTTDARAALDANLARMKESGRTLGMGANQGSQADIDAAFQGMDRRSLHAIASNSGGLFSKDEQAFAQTVMSQQLVEATGMDDPAGFQRDPARGFLAGVRFLDTVSAEEKASDNWRLNRAVAQTNYESSMTRDHPGEKAENVDSGDPVVNFLAQTIRSKEGTWTSVHDGSYVDDLSRITLFKDGTDASGLQKARQGAGTATRDAAARIDITL